MLKTRPFPSITNKDSISITKYLKDIYKLSPITKEEEDKYFELLEQGDNSAAEKIIKANLRFVVTVAKQYQHKGLDLIDLIQEGNIGLTQAVYLYNRKKKTKFITYAVWWIKQSIIKSLSFNCRTVRTPMNQIIYINKINNIIDNFKKITGEEPSVEEINSILNINEKKLINAIKSINSIEPLESKNMEDENSTGLIDILHVDIEDPDEKIMNKEREEQIDIMISKLSSRESDVLRLSFGIGTQKMSTGDIGKRFGVGYETIVTLKKKALQHLKRRFNKRLMELL